MHLSETSMNRFLICLGYVFIYKNKRKTHYCEHWEMLWQRELFFLSSLFCTLVNSSACTSSSWTALTRRNRKGERVGLSVFREKNRSCSRCCWRYQRAAQAARCTRPDTVGWGLHQQPGLQHIYILPYPLSKANSLVTLDTRRVCGDEVWLEVVGRLEEQTEYLRDNLRNKLSFETQSCQ